MAAERNAAIRCAIYTRKSSEEGLEQSFNSLDAQREACQAYIQSQRHEGWRGLGTHYDDGGFSGGTLARPALQKLLEDIDAGKIDTVVVYKVDRLTRSLADFAKIIEIFDAHKVSFVSITQQFNTTTSMGRLTLNVLLSFAQFEREVTGERIRDKIAASKRKGMWMGGIVPLGYDLKERKLIVNPKEAEHVREIYRLYLELGCVSKLRADLDRRGITSKRRTSAAGRKSGGAAYSRGALYEILKNRIYLGEIAHQGNSYAGEHQGLIERGLWEKVQATLKANNEGRRNGSRVTAPSLLVGLIYDQQGTRFTPSHAMKNGRRYRYYVSQNVIQQRPGNKGSPTRIPAREIETLVASEVKSFLGSSHKIMDALGLRSEDASITKTLIAAAQRKVKTWPVSANEAREFLRTMISRVVVHDERIEILIHKSATRAGLLGKILKPESAADSHEDVLQQELFRLSSQVRLKRCGGEVRLVLPADRIGEAAGRTVPSLIKAIARAHDWHERLILGEVTGRRSIAKLTGLGERYVSRILQCAFLAPDIVKTIIDGRQPADLTLEKFRAQWPMDWADQRKRMGFANSRIKLGHAKLNGRCPVEGAQKISQINEASWIHYDINETPSP